MGHAVQNVSFDHAGTEVFGYLAVPESGSGPGVILIQEWWGLTSHIADLTRRLAAAGFVALAPDLYGGSTTHDAAEAMELMAKLPSDRAARDLSGAVDYLLGRSEVTSSTVGVVGFCMGGGFVFNLAHLKGELVSVAVPFYGLPSDPKVLAGLSCAVQGHFGELDQGVPIAAARDVFENLRRDGKTVELHIYGAGHAFVNDENLIGTYDPENAALAWNRAISFLNEYVK